MLLRNCPTIIKQHHCCMNFFFLYFPYISQVFIPSPISTTLCKCCCFCDRQTFSESENSAFKHNGQNLTAVAVVACVSPTASSQRHPDSGEPQKPQAVVSPGLVEARHASDGRGSIFSLSLSATKVPKSHTHTGDAGTGPRAAGRDLGSEAEPLEVDL